MKINRHGRAKVLTQSEIQLIFSHGLDNDRDRMFGVCLFSACRIRECCTLLTQDIYTPKGRVIQEISGHRNLEQLQRYLEVSDEQVLGAAASLAMLSPVVSNGVEIEIYKKLEIDANNSFD
jgi:integrase